MQLQQFTTWDTGTAKRITRVAFQVADHLDPAKRTEWLDVQLVVDVPTARNGLLLRAEVLRRARGILDALADDYENLGRSQG